MADTEQTALTKANNDTKEISIESAESDIKSMIYVIRNQQVMIDSDLAMLYQVETRVLNQAVKRNISRFPERFRFQLTKEEYENLKSQFVISSLEDDNGYGGRRKLPFVFTEQGIAMLSAVLRSDVAIRVSIRIMDTFVEMRKYMANTSLLYERLNAMEVRQINYQAETDERFERVFEYISEHEESSQKVFFDGQIYDAFSLIVNLIQKAEKEITLIDGYVDVGTLNLLSKKKSDVAVTIYTQKQTKLTKADVKYLNAQYPTLKIKYTKVFHDRFLLIKMPFLLIGLKIMLKSLLIEKAEVLCSKSFFLVLHNPVHCLAELKNQLIQQGIYTDCVDGLIFRVIHAPVKKLRVEQAIILFLLTNFFTIHGH